MQGIPAGLPLGMPGIGLLTDGAVQHAPQLGLQFSIVEIVQKMACHSVLETESRSVKSH